MLEDHAHAQFVPPLFARIANEAQVQLNAHEPLPFRGAGRAIHGLRQLLTDIRSGIADQPDLLVVGIDADCGPQGERERQVRRACELERYEGAVVVAEPDPHIEIWYLADPECVQQLLGIDARPAVPEVRCRRQEYKDRLRSIARSSGAPTPLGGVEYGPEIAAEMDLYRAGRNVASLRRFVEAARDLLRGQA